jgi:RHS repeat-associated protein
MFNGKELDEESGMYYYSARYYAPPVFTSRDPLFEEYPFMSPYAYCANNPLIIIDPTGEEVEVEQQTNGTYKVVGGILNDNKNIYIMKDGERTGEILGQSMTEYSFFNEENKPVCGTIIDPSDNSGKEFLNNIMGDRPNLLSYALNARNGGEYDFKSKGKENSSQTSDQYNLRGMPLSGVKGIEGNNIYGSARDVGNFAAGFVSSAAGLDWSLTRTGFDLYQSYKSGNIQSESMASQSAQRMGYNAGKSEQWIMKLYNKIFK